MEDRFGDWMQTASGSVFYPLDAKEEEINIYDIAHALSNICRYGGHSKWFYPVGQHCCYISDACDPAYKLEGLLHDGSEAFLVDIIRPVKPYLPTYKTYEFKLEKIIAKKYNLQFPYPKQVKEMDERILGDEMICVMETPPKDWKLKYERIGIEIEQWSPERTKDEFLTRFEKLKR